MTDLRDHLADFEAAARRILARRPMPRLVLVHSRPATCHPDRPVNARGLCDSCYQTAWKAGKLHQHPLQRVQRSSADFIADYELLRSEGHTRQQIADRLGMTYNAVTTAYVRAVRAEALTPDRRPA